MDWAKELPFEVKQVGVEVEDLTEVEWLFWVGCAGAYEDRAKKTTQAVAELLHTAGVDFAVLGKGETCTGDPARRSGNEFVFAGLAMENAETLKEAKATKVVATCAHCFNTLKNEYRQFGVELEVVHHTQLLNRLVRDGRLTPVAPSPAGPTARMGPARRSPITTRASSGGTTRCTSRRANCWAPSPTPRSRRCPATRSGRSAAAPGARGCGWRRDLGTRINVNRTKEAVATGADQIAVACPFCRVMLSDGLTAEQDAGSARQEVEVLDVAQLLLNSVRRPPPPS